MKLLPPRLLLACLLLVAPPTLAQGLPRGYTELVGDAALEDSLQRAVNQAREEAGVAPLALDASLVLAARHHALEMVELEYFSHTSPLPSHRSLRHRVALAGSALVTLGENLALVPTGSAVAEEAVGGWLASPGHHANLMNPLYTHVGYGTATLANQVYIVQVLAYKPLELVSATATLGVAEAHRITLEIEVAREASVLLTAGKAMLEPRSIASGRSSQTIVLDDLAPVHIRAGVALPGSQRYVLEESGWLDPSSGSWAPDPSAARELIRIARVTVESTSESQIIVDFLFGQAIDRKLAVFANGIHLPDVEVETANLRLVLPAEPTRIDIGEVLNGDRARLIHSLELSVSPPIRVLPAKP